MEQMNTAIEVKEEQITLETTIERMFESGLTTYTTRAGQTVHFQQAKFKQIATVTRLFQEMLALVPREEFGNMISMIVGAQVDAMAQGRAATDLNLNVGRIVEEAIGEKSLLLTVFASCLDILPKFVPQFCDMSAEQFDQLDLDEAVVVATGVVAVNYSFFTRTLPPLLKQALGGWKKKGTSTEATNGKSQSLTNSAG